MGTEGEESSEDEDYGKVEDINRYATTYPQYTMTMEKCWEWVNPPTKEDEIVNKWFACLYPSKKRLMFILVRQQHVFCQMMKQPVTL